MTIILNFIKLQKYFIDVCIEPSQAVHFQEILEIFPTKKEEGRSIHLIQKIFLQ
jgi:hypothetical protein